MDRLARFPERKNVGLQSDDDDDVAALRFPAEKNSMGRPAAKNSCDWFRPSSADEGGTRIGGDEEHDDDDDDDDDDDVADEDGTVSTALPERNRTSRGEPNSGAANYTYVHTYTYIGTYIYNHEYSQRSA